MSLWIWKVPPTKKLKVCCFRDWMSQYLSSTSTWSLGLMSMYQTWQKSQFSSGFQIHNSPCFFNQPMSVVWTWLLHVTFTSVSLLMLHFFVYSNDMFWSNLKTCSTLYCKQGFLPTCKRNTAFDRIHGFPINDTGGLQGNRCSQPKTVTQTGKTFAVKARSPPLFKTAEFKMLC